MKTKHILTALALPAMFAACTAEDIVSENSSIQQDRAKLSENFALVVGADGVESRYNANGGAPEFETGDKIGAALIDQYKYNTPVAQWPIISSLANNTPFTFDASTEEWSVPENQPMGIGNYFFKFPYNNTDRSRAAVIYSLPTVQNQYVDVDGEVDLDEVIETSNMAIAHAVLTEDDEMGEISLKNIFTYPKFRIQFDNGQKVNTVSKVVIFSEGNFVVGSGFNHNAVVNYFNNVEIDKANSWKNNHYDATAKATKWNEVETYDLIYTTNPADGVAKVETSKYLVAKFPNNAEVSYDSNTENKYIDVRFVLPAVNNAQNTTYSMLVYTDNGMYKYTNVYKAIEFKKTTSKEVKESVFARNKNYNLTLEAKAKAEKEEQMIVASKQDWNEIVDVYGDVKEGKYTVVVVGDEFGFDETTEMPEVATITIDGPAYVKGEATLSNIVVNGKTYVEEGAVLTTSATFDPKKAIVNEGEVVIAQVLDPKSKKVVEYNLIETIENKGTLTINEDTKATFALKNAKKAVVENNGEITVTTGTSNGEITNNGEFNSYGFTINKQDNTPNDGEFINESYFYNNGEVFSKAGSFENNGNIVNNEDAVMTCKNQDGTIDNNGELEVVDGSVTYITTNSGNITVDKAVPAELVVKSNAGSITYDAAGSVTFKNSIVNTINVTDDITIADMGSVKTINVDADAEIKLPAAAEVTSLTVAEDVVASLESNLKVTNLTVDTDAELFVPAGIKLEVTASSITNKGVIRVAGTFDASKVLATEAGTVKDNGTSATIYFYNAEAIARKANIQGALKEYIKDAPEYGVDGYVIKLASFQAHLGRVNKDIKNLYPESWDCKAYTDMTQDELDAAASSMYTADETKALIADLKTWSLAQDATLYDYKSTVAKNKTTAYEQFKKVVKHDSFSKTDHAVRVAQYNVTNLSEKQIDEILKDKYAYIWKDCDLHKLVKVWMSYKNFNTGSNDYDPSCANITTLVSWVADVLNTNTNQTPAIGEIQKAIANLGITAANYKYYEGYTTPQVVACCAE